MLHRAKIPVCIVRLFKGKSLYKTLNRGILMGLSLALFLSLLSCATPRHLSYEEQRRGLLMLEGENIYKNKGFYQSRDSHKRHKKTMRAHRRNLKR
jgi:hypothetical protein